jgi:hypothetical protein
MNIEKLKLKIAKLLNMTGRDEIESLAFKSKAFKLASENGLDIQTIKACTEVKDDPISLKMDIPSVSLWRSMLAGGISSFTGCSVLRFRGTACLEVFGRPSDIETFKILFFRAMGEIERESQRFMIRNGGGKSEGDTFRKSAANGFRERLETHRKESMESKEGKITESLIGSGGTSLVLASRAKDALILRDRMYPCIKTQMTSTKGSSNARQSGYAFGKGLGVHRGNIGG